MSKVSTNTHKDVMYIDVDDEITAVIDKVRASKQKIVALVLPKRATVLQSVVNMKLLKRTADQSKKNVVLITSEVGLLPLAGSVGLHVAKSLSSKPEVPDAPESPSSKPESIEEAEDDAPDAPMDRTKTVGELAGAAALEGELDDAIELDEEEAADQPAASSKKEKLLGKKKFRIPNFNKFRLLVAVGVAAVIILSVVGYAAVVVMPKATIVIKTDRTAVNTSSVVTLKTGADTQLDAATGTVPAQIQEVKKTLTQQMPATGQINNGEKATGTIKIINCTAGDPLTIPAGTGASSGGVSFIIDEKVTIPVGSTSCFDSPGTTSKTVGITSTSGGAKYNIAAGTFTVSGYSSKTKASSSEATAGGTDNITKIVLQADIEAAKQKIGQQDNEPIQQELTSGLIGRSLFAIEATFNVGNPETKSDVEPNSPAENVTVTQTITYTMLGVKQEDLQEVAKEDAKKKIDTTKQTIVDYGIDDATFGLQATTPDGASVTMQATVVAGAELDASAIKKQVAGKKASDAKDLIKANPGVTEVTVEYSPFWVSSIPKNTGKITVTIEEPRVTPSERSNAGAP
jgi:hypothetical protein